MDDGRYLCTHDLREFLDNKELNMRSLAPTHLRKMVLLKGKLEIL